ncbi:MAG: right-handed parallel beta-helix repeat-containing protein [Clostridia bacterium]|nr:right-handed parallel beta-helix repeat-containing protein [Clostridia bacterium]
MKYYVDTTVSRAGDGTREYPFKTIQAAADLAEAGDEVLVFPGVYREYVNPKHSGTPEHRITYRSAEPLQAVITGAEPVKNWRKLEGEEQVYTARIPNSFFGNYNPYTTLVSGDWFIASFVAHTGEVYLNHKSMYEVTSLEQVRHPVPNRVSWDSAFSCHVWYTEQDESTDETVLYANFQGADPNRENVEISVRQDCFLPAAEGISYITLSGFTVREAATQWAPPTAYQDGMIGPHWSKGWIIEDCEIYESKCSGISLGKYLQPNNDNKWLKWKYKDGTQTERDCILQASYEGWDKEHIGSHVVRRCHIHDCGQTGIVGHLGGVFSLIEDNHIHHINFKHNLAGAEIGGIKMHAAIDVIYRRNHIHHCTRGLWLDWQAQGTRVTENLFHDNCVPVPMGDLDPETLREVVSALGEDIFVEVSHGPTLIDNNLLLSDRSVKWATQGIALVHNLIAGSFAAVGIGTDNGGVNKPSVRYTPYHEIHGTHVAGFMSILHGDNRIINNIIIQKKNLDPAKRQLSELGKQHANPWDDMNFDAGTAAFDAYPTEDEWKKQFEGYCGMGSDNPYPDRYYDHLPVWIEGNLYCNGAAACVKEQNGAADDREVSVGVEQREDGWYLTGNLYEQLPACNVRVVSTETLGMAFEPEERYENPDGTPIVFSSDYFGNKRDARTIPGPFADAGEAGHPLF